LSELFKSNSLGVIEDFKLNSFLKNRIWFRNGKSALVDSLVFEVLGSSQNYKFLEEAPRYRALLMVKILR